MILDYLINGESNAKYVVTLSALCICSGKPMIKNQRELTKRILLDPKVIKYFLFKVFQDATGDISVENDALGLDACHLIDFSDFNNFNSLKVVNSKVDRQKIFDYFIATITFFADLCFERNNAALDIL